MSISPKELLGLRFRHNELLNKHEKAITDLGYAALEKIITGEIQNEELEKFIPEIQGLQSEIQEIYSMIVKWNFKSQVDIGLIAIFSLSIIH